MYSLLTTRAVRTFSRRQLSTMASADAKFPVTDAITRNLQTAFHPSHLEVINESRMHKVPKDSETHFKVIVVSEEFEKVKTPIQRHRLVNASLAEQLNGPVHALSIVAKTPAQWQKMIDAGETVGSSPACRGGDGSLPSR
jgi:BolA-like protein 1